ncbi:hypothetical protein L195_g006207 [Trifolium pratense]|uniref:Uncharacterized protein n=1 Tax=Trifolium pratense TaxID=57577 RepID=A0A2K3P343_TRIPR|nr:hypothetical protein L195_g006207 [Trifolium pratense]
MGDEIKETLIQIPDPNQNNSTPVSVSDEHNSTSEEKSSAYLAIITIQHLTILGTFVTVERVKGYEEFVNYAHARALLYGLICILEVCTSLTFTLFVKFGRGHALPFMSVILANGACSTMMIFIINSHLWIGTITFWIITALVDLVYIHEELKNEIKEAWCSLSKTIGSLFCGDADEA